MDTKNLTDDDKLNIIKKCALIVSRKRPSTGLEIHELENIGFIEIKSNIPRKAHSEAYYMMLQKASNPRFNRSGKRIQRLFLDTRTAMGRTHSSLQHKYCEYDLETLVDVKNALLQLSEEDMNVAILYLLTGLTQKELCDVLHLSQPTISIKLQAIKERLREALISYDPVEM